MPTTMAGCRAAGPRRCRTLPEACRALPLPRSRRANARARGQTGPRPLLARVLPGPPAPGVSCACGRLGPAAAGLRLRHRKGWGRVWGVWGAPRKGPAWDTEHLELAGCREQVGARARCPVPCRGLRLSPSWARPWLGRPQPRGAGSAESRGCAASRCHTVPPPELLRCGSSTHSPGEDAAWRRAWGSWSSLGGLGAGGHRAQGFEGWAWLEEGREPCPRKPWSQPGCRAGTGVNLPQQGALVKGWEVGWHGGAARQGSPADTDGVGETSPLCTHCCFAPVPTLSSMAWVPSPRR